MPHRPGPLFVLAALIFVAVTETPSVIAEIPRDMVFECPCHAEWVPGEAEETGELRLTFGVRSHRATASGELWLRPHYLVDDRAIDLTTEALFGSAPAGARFTDQTRTIALAVARPTPGALVRIMLREQTSTAIRRFHETLTLWPVSEDARSGNMQFVDILTDTDGDGVGDVNERIASTSPENPSDTPGLSTVDVLAIYDDQLRDFYDGYPFTRIHHVMVLANASFVDSETNIRLRTVEMREADLAPPADDLAEMMDIVGADLMIGFAPGPPWPCGAAPGCAEVSSLFDRGSWQYGKRAWASATASAITTAHELGHVMGLAHSARNGESYGAFRWSRGHYLQGEPGNRMDVGTVMDYGIRWGVVGFSNPGADCLGRPCGVPIDLPDGADAVKSLNLLRFQAAAHRAPKPDTDGDGFVDAADAVPNDARDWRDFDGDGLGDNADSDDDNDGVADAEDAFPYDSTEWADLDADFVGDNADDEVLVSDISPFKDPWLRAAVERTLGKSPGASITHEHLSSLMILDASIGGRGIRDLSGLDQAPNLVDLNLSVNAIADLSPLSELNNLLRLNLSANVIEDLSPLSALTKLEALDLSVNAIADLSPLSTLTQLQTLVLYGNAISDLSSLSALANLKTLDLRRNAITDPSPLSALANLKELDLSGNAISDPSPLSRLTNLEALYLGRVSLINTFRGRWNRLYGNAISDLSTLSQLTGLHTLYLSGNAISDLSPLSELINLSKLDLRANLISDLRPLSGFKHSYDALYLGGNAISDLSPLSELTGLDHLDLSSNNVSNLAPLVNDSVWAGGGSKSLNLNFNPLDDPSVDEHIQTLASMGVSVDFHHPNSFIPDPALRALVSQTAAGRYLNVDESIDRYARSRLVTLLGFAAGISDLTGIEELGWLRTLDLAANSITDITVLENLEVLTKVDLSDNQISDISPLAHNRELGEGDWISLTGNPLSEESVNTDIPTLLERGVEVDLYYVSLSAIAGEGVSFDTSGYFTAFLGSGVRMDAVVSDRALARANVVDGVLTVTPGGAGGTVTVTVTATDDSEASAALTFRVKVKGVVVPMLSAASDPVRQGFVRVINHSPRPGEARIQAIDDAGTRRGPITLAIGAREVVHFNSDDLELGKADSGLSEGVGAGEGDWRLEVESDLDLDVLSYIRTDDGFLTSMHDLPPLTETGQRIAIFNPGGNRDQVSLLRLINPGEEAAEVSIVGVDSNGASPGGPVTLTLDASAARTVTAQELESGEGLTGALGDGEGKWWLDVTADKPIVALSLLRSPTGHLTNLSRMPNNKEVGDDRETIHHVPVFLSAADPEGRQGFVRVVNRGVLDTTVRIEAQDDTDFVYDGLELTVPAGGAAHFNSDDLEIGNAGKDLSGATGAGEGDWRLTLTSAADIDVLAYIRTKDGFLTSMHDTVPPTARGHAVPIFNPASNRNQVSLLRIANMGGEQASVFVRGIDDQGATRGDAVVLSVPVGQSRTISAQALEQGADAFTGRLGDGEGKWRLNVMSYQPIQVTSLLESPTGHLSNLSRAVGAADDGALGGAEEDSLAVSDFRDPALRAAFESALHISPGEPISAADLASLTVLNGAGRGIQDLTGINQATGLEKLSLGGNAISDLSPLSGLTKLDQLNLAFNAVSDLSPLTGLTSLRTLDLTGNAISDLSPLSTLTILEQLHLSFNAISDLSPLSGLTSVQQFNLSYNSISDLSPMSTLTSLRILYLGNNAISDLSSLSGLSNIEYLGLSFNAVSDLSPLAGLTELRLLEVNSNVISDLSPLADLTKLNALYANSNAISDLSPLAGLTSLGTLSLISNVISELSPLSGLNLEFLYVGDTNVTLPDIVALPYFRELRGLGLNGLGIMDISALAELNNAISVRLSDNLISDVSPLGGLTGLWRLELNGNEVEDIGPLAVRSLWNDYAIERGSAILNLLNNPLDQVSIDEHIETLRFWGVDVKFE